MLVGINIDNWWRAVGNEHGILANGIDNRVKFIRKGEVPRGRTVTYTKLVFDYCPLKSKTFRVRLIVSGNRLEYPKNAASLAAFLLESKLVFNGTISYVHRCVVFL